MLSTVLSFRLLHKRTKIPVFRELNINGGRETKNSKPRAILLLVAPLFLTLCNPMDCSPPASSVHRIILASYWRELSFSTPEDLPNS